MPSARLQTVFGPAVQQLGSGSGLGHFIYDGKKCVHGMVWFLVALEKLSKVDGCVHCENPVVLLQILGLSETDGSRLDACMRITHHLRNRGVNLHCSHNLIQL